MKDIRKFAATSNMVRVFILDSSLTTGAGLSTLVFGTTGLVIDVIANNAASGAVYHYKSAATATIQDIGTTGSTCGTYAAPSASNCRFAPVDTTNFPGLYEIQFLDGLFDDSGCASLIGKVSGPTNCTPTMFEIRLSVSDRLDTANPSANVVLANLVSAGSDLTSLGIMSLGTLAAGGSTTAFTLPAGQRANVAVGDILVVPTIGKKRILTYTVSTGAGTTAAFSADTSSTAYIVFAAPANTVLTSADVDATLLAGDTLGLAIKAKTDNLPSDPADASDVAAEIALVSTAAGGSSSQGKHPDGSRTPTS